MLEPVERIAPTLSFAEPTAPIQISITSSASNTIIYQVPPSRIFTGIISNNASSPPAINGVQFPGAVNNITKEVSLVGGTTVMNSVNQTTIIGIERDAV